MNRVPRTLRGVLGRLQNQDRDPRYIVMLLWAVPLFTLTCVQALNRGWFDSIEKPLFEIINNWPAWLGAPMYLMTQFGSLLGVMMWIALAWYLINRRAATSVVTAGIVGWLVAKIVKGLVARGRPEQFLPHIHLFNQTIYGGYGFPSGHSTVVAACVTVLLYQVRPRYRKYLLLTALLVGVSRMYLGAHFPLDVVGGWALGAICGSLIMLVMGSSVRSVTAASAKRALTRKGYEIRCLRFANLDARGSRPAFIETVQGDHYFGKIFGEKEHAADWLFKLYRFFRYKNLQAEEPYLNPRRNIELESFANLWAKRGGARSPKIIDIVKIGRHWLLIQEQLDAKPMPEYKRISQKTLEDAWRQVKKLHAGNLAHRDLRAANLMIDRAGRAWIIDYGFAEIAPNNARQSMDISELLMSMSLVVGTRRTVDAAIKVFGRRRIRQALPYLHRSVFSGATNQSLRKNKEVLKELQTTLKKQLAITGEIEEANVDRITIRKVIYLAILSIFAYVVIPQFAEFQSSLTALHHVQPFWLVMLFVFSVLTYLAAGAVFVALASIPLKIREASLVQLAASFMSKILPGGAGATGVNVRYLMKSGLDKTEASALIVGQNSIGFIMFILPLLFVLLMSGHGVRSLFRFHIEPSVLIAVGALFGLILVAIVSSKKMRGKVLTFITDFAAQLRDLSTSPRELSFAALASFAISISYIACLAASLYAIHASIPLTTIVLVYASAIIAKTAVPTPGGLGPVEVAMSAALIGAGLSHGDAFAAVVLYRLGTFWVPIPLSVIAYRYVVGKRLI